MCLRLGYCAEFNVVGGVIQTQYASPCNNATFPICNKPYQSTEAYNCKLVVFQLNLNLVNLF